jgi:hypothetical protein
MDDHIEDMSPVELAVYMVTLPGFDWAMPWCSMPDDHGRVFRRNCSLDNPGVGWSQVSGPILRDPWDSSKVVIDLHDSGSFGALYVLVERAAGGPVGVIPLLVGHGIWWDARTPHKIMHAKGPTRVHALVALLRRCCEG